jgi:hypothetical protein
VANLLSSWVLWGSLFSGAIAAADTANAIGSWACTSPANIEIGAPKQIVLDQACSLATACLKQGLDSFPHLARQNQILCGNKDFNSPIVQINLLEAGSQRGVASEEKKDSPTPLRLEDVLEP